jgi:hypothetical protein
MAFQNKPAPRRGNSPEFEAENTNSLSSLGNNIARETFNTFTDIGKSMFDQFMGTGEQQQQWNPEQYQQQHEQMAPQPRRNERITLFSFREQKERQEIQQIKELLKQIREEIKAIKKSDEAFMNEVNDIEKLTLETDPKAGIYHIRFLEVMLKFLHSFRVKLGESRTWLSVLTSKKGKRGSLFAKRSKEQGTQYMLSQELSNARSVQ